MRIGYQSHCLARADRWSILKRDRISVRFVARMGERPAYSPVCADSVALNVGRLRTTRPKQRRIGHAHLQPGRSKIDATEHKQSVNADSIALR